MISRFFRGGIDVHGTPHHPSPKNGPECDLGKEWPELASATEIMPLQVGKPGLYFASLPSTPKDPALLAQCHFFNVDNELVSLALPIRVRVRDSLRGHWELCRTHALRPIG